MNGRRLERGRLAGEQRMLPTGVALQNAPGKPELTAARIGAYLAACGGYRDLQAPAAAEERNAGGKDGLGEVDLAGHGSAAVVDVECRSGHGDAVVALEADSLDKRSAVRGGQDVDAERRIEAVQHPRVAGSRVISERCNLAGANLGDVAVDDQDTRACHAAPSTAARLPSTAARKMRSSCAASTGMGLPPADGSTAASRPMIAALSALTPMPASVCGIPRSRRILSTQSKKPSQPDAGRFSTRAMISVLSSIALRLNVMT